MKESAVYQEILQEGEQRGLLKEEQRDLFKGKLEVAQKLFKGGLALTNFMSLTGVSADVLKNASSPITHDNPALW